jgi:hypothetical protein
MSDSQYLFNYLNNVWDLLPERDRKRFGETWKAYEQTYGDAWSKLFERDLGNSVDFVPLYNNQRWLSYLFNNSTKVLRAAHFRSIQDLSTTINLSSRYLIKLAVDGGTPVEVDLRGSNPAATTLPQIVLKINTAMGIPVAKATNGQLLDFRSLTTGPTSKLTFFAASDPAADASAVILGLDPSTDLPYQTPGFPYEYQLPDRFIVGIPELQTTIHKYDSTQTLSQGVDYIVDFGTGIISFKEIPPAKVWAPDTLLNKEAPYNQFGFLMDIYDSNTPAYLKAVKGLWFAFWTGPRPENIRRALYLLFGLPTASQPGTVTSVTATQIRIRYTDDATEVFDIPPELIPLVTVGQSVDRFQPLVSGIQVFDKVNYPGFMTREGGRSAVAPFLVEGATTGIDPSTDESRALRTLEEHTYLPQIDVNSFISPDIKLSNVQTFLKNIQPKSRQYLFQVLVGTFRDRIPISDEGNRTATNSNFPNGIPALAFDITFDATANVDWNINRDTDLASLEDSETNDYTHLVLDSHVFTHGDRASIEVYQSSSLVDSFDLEG